MSWWKVSNNRRGGVTFWAWAVSIVIHTVVLGIFAIIRLSQVQVADKQRVTPTAGVSQVRKVIEAEPVIPKPKIKKYVADYTVGAAAKLSSAKRTFDIPRPILRSYDDGSKSPISASKAVVPLSNSAVVEPKVEFFGSFTDERKIYYVVDCSGSMGGVFGRVQRKLAESIDSLEPDQYFYILFFGGDRLFEYGDGRLTRATPQAKSAARGFIESVQPAGATNTMEAMERAIQVRDSKNGGPSIIYFLTDGFELISDDGYRFIQKILNVRKSFAPGVKINTIGFWPQESDRRILEKIAKQTGGEFVYISD
jgi:hypothetical protein